MADQPDTTPKPEPPADKPAGGGGGGAKMIDVKGMIRQA